MYPIQLEVIENRIFLNDAFCRLLNTYEGEELAFTIRAGTEIEIYKAKFFSPCKAVITDNCIMLSPAYLIEPLVYKADEGGFLEANFQKDRFVLTPGVPRCRRCFTTEEVEKHDDSFLCKKCHAKKKDDLYLLVQEAIKRDADKPSELETELYKLALHHISEFQRSDYTSRFLWKLIETALIGYPPDSALLLRASIETLTAKAGEYFLSDNFLDKLKDEEDNEN